MSYCESVGEVFAAATVCHVRRTPRLSVLAVIVKEDPQELEATAAHSARFQCHCISSYLKFNKSDWRDRQSQGLRALRF